MDKITDYFSRDFTFTVTMTVHDDINTAIDRTPVTMTAAQVAAYLTGGDAFAVILHGSKDRYNGTIAYAPPIWIARGAGDPPNNFAWGEWPAEDPNDANGGNLDVAEALRESTEEYYE